MRTVRHWAVVMAALALAGAGGELRAAPAVTAAPDTVRALPGKAPYAEGHETECVLGGPLVALSVLPYVARAAAAAASGVPEPALDVPVLATGFAFGCSTGEVMAPALWWMYRYF